MPGYHDSFFKQVFSDKEHAIDFTKHVLPPEISKNLNFSRFNLENVSYIDEELAEHFSDMVYSCFYNQSLIQISLLFEHKSYPDNNLPYQLLKYMIRIWEYNVKQKENFIPVVPIVLYHGKEGWNPGGFQSSFKDLPAELISFIPDFKYVFIDLSDYSDDDIKKRIFIAVSLKISMLILKNIFYPEKLEKALNDFFTLGKIFFQEEKGLKFLETIVKYLYQATEIETGRIIKAIEPVTKKGGEIAMNTAERLRQEGMQKGRQEGIRQGSYNTYLNLIQNMKKNKVSDKDIAKFINVDIDIVKKIINKEQVDIPLHLLDQDLKGV
jgi:predicted transposase/invertase (TIGR01784 family)